MRLIDADAFKQQVAAMAIQNGSSTAADKAKLMMDLIDGQPTREITKRQLKDLEKIKQENEIKALWLEFGDVLMDPETEELECTWHIFPAGTHREEVWHWFEDTYGISVTDLLYAIDDFHLK